MDQRQYRADQPCDDATGAPACADYDQPRTFLGTRQMNWLKTQLNSSKAAWKVLANEVTIMPTRVLGGAFFGFDSWDGYPQERESCSPTSATARSRTSSSSPATSTRSSPATCAPPRAPATLPRSSSSAARSPPRPRRDRPAGAGGGVVIKGNDKNPHTDPSIIEALKGINPWVDQADFDHHGYGKVVATKDAFDCELVRMQTIKKKSTAKLPSTGMHYRVARGQQSIKGTAM